MTAAGRSLIAMIPARAGSKRIADKNIRCLCDHPLMAYTICAAVKSGIFTDVVVSTDSERYADIARHYGASVPFLRPQELAGEVSPDIEWVTYTLDRLSQRGRVYECFSILRPTSPFRLPTTIRRAWRHFQTQTGVDSLRAVEKCRQHPGKMWVVKEQRMTPLIALAAHGTPWHSSPYQSLPEIHVQNASLEIAFTRVVYEQGTIAGNALMPFFTQDYEGFDINNEYDWNMAQYLVGSAQAKLPRIRHVPYVFDDE